VPASIGGAFNGDQTEKGINIVSLYICAAPINVFTDTAILVLPLPMVTAMHLDIRQKVGLVATFMTGLFVTVVGVVRIAYLQEALIDQVKASVVSSSFDKERAKDVIADFSWHASYSYSGPQSR
jgi:hypothetical protein